jgi:hypothetical protein
MSANIRFTAKSQTTADLLTDFINWNRTHTGPNYGRNHPTAAARGSLSYYNNVLYSYDLEICRYCRGAGVFMIFNHRAAARRKGAASLGTRSPTTGKHITQFINMIIEHNNTGPHHPVKYVIQNYYNYMNLMNSRHEMRAVCPQIHNRAAYKIAQTALLAAGIAPDVIKYVIKGYIYK